MRKNFNFLGVIINKQLKWNDHIDQIVLKYHASSAS